MKRPINILISLIVTSIAVLYLLPPPQTNLSSLYPDSVYAKLQRIRQEPVKEITFNGHKWIYLSCGAGDTALLFLHGMGGSYDIWFQQIDWFKNRYRIISPEYPPVHTLEELAAGIIKILESEHTEKVVVIGSSLGGYLAQYLAAHYPGRIVKASLGNTFPPNDEIKNKNRLRILLMHILPEWIVINEMKRQYRKKIIPASGNSQVASAFLLSILGSKIKKANLIARYHCVVDYFNERIPEDIPVQIIESDNDPLITPSLRKQLKIRHPGSSVFTLHHEGHFPYLSHPDEYNHLLEAFIRKN